MSKGGRGKKRERIDKLLLERGLCESRTRAQAMVLAGQVVVDDARVDKPGTAVRIDADIRVKGADHAFVSRGGVKLQGALDHFAELSVAGRRALDVGASTGGFTDCLLQRGATFVHAVDVGYGQMAWRLAQDPRVRVHDRTNIRAMDPEILGERVDLVVGDCSFISLTKVLPHLVPHLAAPADLVLLVKPQFEVGREGVGKGGIVRDPAAREAAVDGVARAAESCGFEVVGRCHSPIAGREGNVESFLWLRYTDGDGDPGEGSEREVRPAADPPPSS